MPGGSPDIEHNTHNGAKWDRQRVVALPWAAIHCAGMKDPISTPATSKAALP